MKHDRTFFAATGIPSLFLIFSVLCLAVLSLLTLGKSRDELLAANYTIQQTDLYYKTRYVHNQHQEDRSPLPQL